MSYFNDDRFSGGLTIADLLAQNGTGKAVPQAQMGNSSPVDVNAARAVSPVSGLNPFLIPDGFAYNVHLKYLPYRSWPMLVRLLDRYRRESLIGLWQPRWYVVPVSPLLTIAAGDTFNYELHVARGSLLWAYSFSVLDPGTPNQLRVYLRDICRQNDIISQFELASSLRASLTAGTPSAGFNVVPLAEPWRVPDTGNLQVNIVNTDASASKTAQLLMLFIEPTGSPQ